MTKVSITSISTYAQTEINQAIHTHFERFGLADKITADMHVLLKPNLVMKRKPEEFTTTHPSIVEAVVVYLKQLGIKRITIADSPGGPFTESALKGIYDACGMTGVAKRQSVNLNFQTNSEQVSNRRGKLVKSFPIIQPVCEADFIINLCKLKTHAMTGLSGAVKNIFGVIPGLTKPEFHWRFPEKQYFCEMLVDLCDTVQPAFTVVDAIQAMEGDGPSGGTKRESGLILASDNPYDLDLILCKLIGTSPDSIYTVKASVERGLCSGDLNKIQVIGTLPNLQPFITPHDTTVDFTTKVPKLLKRPAKLLTSTLLRSKPKIRTKDCIGCGKCAESCPAKTICMKERKATIHYKQCICCFCCHEMCPVKAIDIKRSRLFSK